MYVVRKILIEFRNEVHGVVNVKVVSQMTRYKMLYKYGTYKAGSTYLQKFM